MIRHICMFKLKEENKAENLAELLRRVETLRPIPQIKRFAVETNAEGLPEDNYEVALIFDFENAEELEIYRVSEPHVEFGKFMRTIRESRACIDYKF